MTRGGARLGMLGAAAVVAAGVAVPLASSSEEPDHHLFAVVPDAVNVIPGQEVRAAGQVVGEVASLEPVRRGRAARVALRIEDTAWPLPRGSTLRLRWGGTITSSNRYIELRRGPAGAPAIPAGATLGPRDFEAPVEFDRFLTTFTPAVRRDFRGMIESSGRAFRAAEVPLGRAVESAPEAMTETGALLEDLEAESSALATLVRSGDSVIDAVRRADPDLGRLVSSAAATFEATAGEARSLQATLEESPRTLVSTRATLARADATLGAFGELTGEMAPGVSALRRLSGPLARMLRSLRAVGPTARSALGAMRRATPQVDRLLVRTTDLMPRFGSIGRQSADQLRCIRPYAPEIAAFFSTWADWTSNSDGAGTYTRLALMTSPFSNAETRTSADIARDNPGLTYAFPRPPGMNANQPWFLPECGAGRDALDPAKDPETPR